ncbi:hypothetical protein Tco_0341979, partial [Tanacetum coccineum]
MIHGQAHIVRVKEFAGWVPDIEAMDTLSEKKSDVEMSEEQDNILGDNEVLNVEEGEIQETKEENEENVKNNHNFSWAEDIGNVDKDQFVASPINQPMESKNRMPSESSE